MEQTQEQPAPLTPKQREAEANYAKRIYEKLSNPTPELLDQMLENITRNQKPRPEHVTKE